MLHVEQVAAGIGDNAEHGDQGARAVVYGDAQHREAAGPDKPPVDGGRKNPRVDVRTAEDDADRPACEAMSVGEHGGQAGAPGPLHDGLLDLEQEVDGVLDGILIDSEQLGLQRPHDLGCQPAGV